MFLYLGGGVFLKESELIGIFDLDNSSWAHKTREFLASAQKCGEVVSLSDQLPRSFVVAQRQGKRKIYISERYPSTLSKRFEGEQLNQIQS
ncbi:MAG: DUF370 domain-containing protein [Eubacteriales bacterium]